MTLALAHMIDWPSEFVLVEYNHASKETRTLRVLTPNELEALYLEAGKQLGRLENDRFAKLERRAARLERALARARKGGA